MRIKTLLLPVLILLALSAHAQDTIKNKPVMVYVDQMPRAGYDYQDFLARNIHYPKKARKQNIEGRVIIKFVVNTDGSISDVTVVKGIGGGCDEEAVRVVSSFPKWLPGKIKDEPVRVYFTLPIHFALE